MTRRVRGGFTLIELLVVVSIVALLLGILLPSLKGARGGAKRVACGANLRGIGQALRGYLNESNDILPVVAYLPSLPGEGPPRPSLPDTLRPYLEKDSSAQIADMEVFRCPADTPGVTDRGAPNENKSFFETEGTSYQFNTRLYWFMRDQASSDPWLVKPTSLYNFVRNPDIVQMLGGQPTEQEIWLIRDYAAFHGGPKANRPINFLYIDGHVADLER